LRHRSLIMSSIAVEEEEVFYDTTELSIDQLTVVQQTVDEFEEEGTKKGLITISPENLSRFKIYDPIYMEEVKQGIDMVLENKFEDAEALFKTKSEMSLYHLDAYQCMLFLKAVMSFNQDDVQLALAQLNRTSSLCNRLRKKPRLVKQLASWFKRKPKLPFISPEKNQEDEDLVLNSYHTDLIYAESLLLRAVLTLISDESLLSLIKCSLNIRSAFLVYKSCWTALSTFPSDDIDQDYSTGVLLGIGTFNMMFSLLPPRVMKCFELLGFSGDRDFGLQQLNRGARQEKGLRAPICVMFVLFL
jgi:hypothetical protein